MSISGLYAQSNAISSDSENEFVSPAELRANTIRKPRKQLTTASIGALSERQIMAGQRITIGTPALEGYTYQWIVGGKLYATSSMIEVEPSENTVYIRKTIDEISGRINADQVRILVKDDNNYVGLK